MKPALLVIIVGALYILHQDFWFWRTAHPLMFGFLPIGLSYHAGFTVVTSLVLQLLVSKAWPAHLEDELERNSPARGGPGPKTEGGQAS
jgi:hypothetical protein